MFAKRRKTGRTRYIEKPRGAPAPLKNAIPREVYRGGWSEKGPDIVRGRGEGKSRVWETGEMKKSEANLIIKKLGGNCRVAGREEKNMTEKGSEAKG